MNANEYQKWTAETAIYPEASTGSVNELMYCTLGLAGEAGEVANIVKKLHRDGDSAEKRENLKKELSDVMWYAARIAQALDISLEDLLELNYTKIADRKARSVLAGSGDNR